MGFRKKDSTKHMDIELTFVPYTLVMHDENSTWDLTTQWDCLQKIQEMGFEVNKDAALFQRMYPRSIFFHKMYFVQF
jgi:NAD-dependent DNA ligase